MATCPSGHESASDDFCDVCGVLIGAAPELSFDAGLGAGGGTTAPASAQAPGVTVGGGAPPGEPCPQCGVTRAGQFCESCGYDFTTAWAAPPSAAWTAAPPPVAPVPPASAAPPPFRPWPPRHPRSVRARRAARSVHAAEHRDRARDRRAGVGCRACRASQCTGPSW